MYKRQLKNGTTAVVDGFTGQVTFEPDEETQAATLKSVQEEKENLALLQELKGKENITLDGKKINIYANIGSVGDIGYVLENLSLIHIWTRNRTESEDSYGSISYKGN